MTILKSNCSIFVDFSSSVCQDGRYFKRTLSQGECSRFLFHIEFLMHEDNKVRIMKSNNILHSLPLTLYFLPLPVFEAYREPDYTYRISVHFTTKECNLAANRQFFEELQKILNNLLDYLKCHIIDSSYRCFSVKRPKHGLVDELFIVFQGNEKVMLCLAP